MKYIMSFLSVLMLSACGGGGSDAKPIPATTTVVDQSSTGSQQQGVAALNVAPEFDFKTDIAVTVKVAASLVNERAFINICDAEAVLTNSDTCFIRSPLTDRGLEMSFTLPHQEQKVKAEIWFYDTSLPPLYYEWHVNNSQTEQVWLIN